MSLRFASFARNLLGIFLISLTSVALAQKVSFVEGKDYRLVKPAQAVETPAGKIEVIEFFWYGCPHCYSFESSLNDWIKKQAADVVVRHIPAAFNDSLVPHQRLYYALDALGKEADLRAKVFAAIHVERNPLNKEEIQADFVARNGIDRKKFIDTYNSFTVQSKTRRASQLAEGFGVDGVPMMAVNGKYTIPNAPNTLAVLDYLVARERMGTAKK